MILHRWTDAILQPHLVQVERDLVLCGFPLMKLIPASHVIKRAFAEGRIDPAAGVAETSSGTYALGLGMVSAELGISFHVFSDPVIEPPLKRRLEDLGGIVHIVATDPARSANMQTLRLEALGAHLAANPGAFWTQQYDNSCNMEAYYPVADRIHDVVGKSMILVGAVGSGTSTCGIVKRLRERGVEVALVGVDTFGSVLFGQPNGPRSLRGLGNSLVPKNLLHDSFDEVHWVTARDAFAWTRRLHRKHGAFFGPTSGATYQVGRWIRDLDPGPPTVFIAADDGSRYLDNVYHDAWLQANGYWTDNPLEEPTTVTAVSDASDGWCRYLWNRRSFEAATGLPIPS